MTKDSKVTSRLACRTLLASSEPADLVEVNAVTVNRGALTYVLGYAKNKDNLWLNFLGSSADPSKTGDLVQLCNSIAVTLTQ